jgi:tetratricopeptide (TPR) repeat protein
MRIVLVVLAFLCAVALPLPGFSQQEKLGKVAFPTSCDAKVQGQFERGVAMLHSYWFTEARKVFDAVIQQDPSCAIAYWGLAVNYLGNSLAAAPSSKDIAAASEGLDKARAIGAKTQRERDWIEAIGVYYRDPDTVPLNARLIAYTKAMEQMTQRYPDDFEAWTYYALTLQASAPRNDKAYGNQLKSAEILERLFKQNPEHPGVAHYLVHAYDYPSLADKGIRIAGQYARIAPAAPHARHMPSHIYSMVGMWEESIASNRSALEVQPDYHHATDFMVYAYLQLAQDAKAKALVDLIVALPQREYPILANFTAVAAIPARYALERADWAGAAALPVSSTGRVMADSLTRFWRAAAIWPERSARSRRCRSCAAHSSSRASPIGPIAPRSRSLPPPPGSRTRRVRATRRRSSCARPPTAKMAVSSTWRWRTGSIRCASCSVSCCSRSGSQRPR